MTKTEILEAIQEVITPNGVKAITADSLRNILTMMTENAGEGGSGEGALRVMMPDAILTDFSSPLTINREYFEEIGSVIEGYNQYVDEFFAQNAAVYAKVVEKAWKGEPVLAIADFSKFTLIGHNELMGANGGILFDGMSITYPMSCVSCVANDGGDMVIFEIRNFSMLNDDIDIMLDSDGTMHISPSNITE